MRVLLLSNKFPWPANDGSSIAVHEMMRALVHGGCKLTLFSLNTRKHRKDPENVPAWYENIDIRTAEVNTDIDPLSALLNLFSGQSYFVSRFDQNKVGDQLAVLLKEREFDIVQCEGLFMLPYLSVIRQYSKAPCLYRAHNVEYLIWERHLRKEGNPLRRAYLRLQTARLESFEKQAVRKVDGLMPITQMDGTVLSQMGCRAPMHVAPCSLPLKDIPTCQPRYPGSFYFLGTFDWLPNLQGMKWFLEEVWPRVQGEDPGIEFYIAGRHMPGTWAKKNIPGIRFHGEISDVDEFLSRYDILVVPLLSGSGLRIKIVQALAAGKPVITTPVGAEGIDYSHGDDIYIAGNATEFARGIITLASDKALLEKLRTGGRRLAEDQFDMQTTARRLIRFYRDIRS